MLRSFWPDAFAVVAPFSGLAGWVDDDVYSFGHNGVLFSRHPQR